LDLCVVCRLGVVAGLVLALVVGVSGVAGAQPSTGVDLVASVTLDRDAYLPGEDVQVTLHVANHGDTAADEVVAHVVGNVPLTDSHMGWFWDWEPGAGAYVGAGQTQSETFSFVLPAETRPVFALTVSSSAVDAKPSDNRIEVVVPIPGARASLGGVLYGDKDGDGAVDTGEALTGVQLSFHQGMAPWGEFVVRTGANGRFTIPELVIGEYWLTVQLPPGWRIDDRSGQPSIHVVPGANTLDLRALRVVKPTLEASVRFDRPSYAVGDTIREHVRITNTGTREISGITALCTGPGNPNELSAVGWGDLAPYTGAGVTLRAGETRDFTFTDVVPQGGYDYGDVHLDCSFGLDQHYQFGVVAHAEAAVPGGRGDLTGTLYLDEGESGYQDGEGLPHAKVYIVNRSGDIAARTFTDDVGRFTFRGVPAATYELRFVGPWRYAHRSALFWYVVNGRTSEIDLQVLPGPSQPDPDAPPPDPDAPSPSTSDDPPQPQARGAGVHTGLADTGASVRELTGLGIGLLLVGFWLLVLPMRARREP
jgi:hypothetical protein